MSSPRGHILRFLWKQSQGAFLELSLDDIKKKLVDRGTLTEEGFDSAKKDLELEGVVSDNALTKGGATVYETEYKQYLAAAEAMAPEKLKSDFIAARAAFDAIVKLPI